MAREHVVEEAGEDDDAAAAVGAEAVRERVGRVRAVDDEQRVRRARDRVRRGRAGARARELREAVQDLGPARARAQRVLGGRGERDVVRAAVDPLRAELGLLLQRRDRALEPAEGVADPDEAPVRGREDLGRAFFCGEDLPYCAVPARSRELRGDVVLFLWR